MTETKSWKELWSFLFKEHAELLVLIVIQFIAVCAVQVIWMEYNIFWYYLNPFPLYIFLCYFTLTAVMFMVPLLISPTLEGSLFGAWWVRFRGVFFTRDRMTRLIFVAFLYHIMGASFYGIKASIPYIHFFSWDQTLDQWDIQLHFGKRPWEWMQPYTNPLITFIIDCGYFVWLMLSYGIFFWMAASERWKLRKQFLLSFTLAWILLGNLGAVIFSSVGPCFYGPIFPDQPDPYEEQMVYLKDVDENHLPLSSLYNQNLLLTAYQEQQITLTSGISAFPSLHVAISVLLALTLWKVKRWLGICLALFALLIQIGSFHLAWHYAVDGYASAVAIVLIWYAAGAWYRYRDGEQEEKVDQKVLTEEPA
jgi:membrane protein YdbS with pleckstrin-like domain